jgi:hypothetical protein
MASLADKLDLDLAWRRVKADVIDARSFVYYPLELELVEVDKDSWLNQLRDKVAAGYRPHSAMITDVPKGNGAVRPAALLSLEDRVIYAAAVGAILPSINAGLKWSQGTVDFSYRLSEAPRRVEWFTNAYNSWSAFRKVSVERIDGGAAFSVLTDITGFYENIELPILFSDLRSLGCDNDVIQLLQTFLNRWCVVSNRGLPQGLSPSDVLAKVYLNPVDLAMADMNIDYIRYVDDMRIFCRAVPECKNALMFLTQLLRRRGLNLQSAKTEIVSGPEAKTIIEGIAPVIAEVQEKYREFLVKRLGAISPYATIEDLEENVFPHEPPMEVVREVFRLNFIEEGRPFNKTLLHYLLNRLAANADALTYSLSQLAPQPQETQAILDYANDVHEAETAFPSIEAFLESPDCIYDYQVYQIFKWLNKLSIPPSPGLVVIARRFAFDNGRAPYLRAECRIVLQNHGSTADLERLEASYGAVHDELEKGQVLVALKRLEVGRRNAFYGRVIGDGLLCERAITFVKAQRL